MSKEQIEQKAASWAYCGARVTPAHVQESIASERYFTAAQGLIGAHVANLPAEPIPGSEPALTRVTFCLLTMRNGTQIVGVNYGAIDPAQHDSERAKTEARADAVRQIWPLLGYELRSRVHAAAVGYAIACAMEG